MADEALYESVLTRGNPSPRNMERMVTAILLGKGSDDSSSETESTTTSSSESTPTHSKQLTGDPFDAMAPDEFVPPRYKPEVWAAAMEGSTRLGRSIRTYARNTVGLGWFIEPLHKPTPETSSEIRKKVKEQTATLQKIFERPNPLMPTTSLFYAMKIDEEATGNGYIEVVRNNKGDIVQLYHAPAVTMRIRVRKAEEKRQVIGGFIQIRGNEKRYFKEFGDKGVMNAETGKYHKGDTPLPIDKRATEILHFKLYSPTSTWYGSPRYVSAATAVSGNRLAALRNVKFFENDAVPRMALLVSGGRLTPESIQEIETFFKAKLQGPEKAHSVCVIQAEQTKVGFQQTAENTKLDLRPLTVGVTEDASFGAYREANDEEIREAFGLAPVFFSTENVNKASATTSREITNEQELEPDRLEKEYIINQTLIPDILGEEPYVRFRFERMKLTDPLDTARMDQTYAGLGALTPNELRESIGKPPYPKEYKFADRPMQVAMAELSMQLAEAIVGEWKGQIKHQIETSQAQQQATGMGAMAGGFGGGTIPGIPPPGGAPGGAPGEAPPAEGAPVAGEGKVSEEWSSDVAATTEESSPVSAAETESTTTEDSHVRRVKEALDLAKNSQLKSDMPISTLLGIAVELMADARRLGATNIPNAKQEDSQ